MSIDIHTRENNKESESYVSENKRKFNSQCKLLLKLMLNGKRINVDMAYRELGVYSLPRRVCDLKQNGVPVQDRWLKSKETGKRSIKEYYLPDSVIAEWQRRKSAAGKRVGA